MQSLHELGRIVCDRCGGLVRKRRNVKSHMKRNHKNGKFTCHECGIPAEREVLNEWLMQSAHVHGKFVKEGHDDEDKPEEFDNTVEDEALLSLGDVKEVYGLNNSVVKSGNKVDLLDRTRSFPCEVCGQKFKLKRNLVSRVCFHVDFRPYNCDHCGTRAKWGSMSEWHMESIHVDFRSYKCEA